MSFDKRRLLGNAGLSALQVVVAVALLFILYRTILAELGPEVVGLWSTVLASVSVARLSDIGFSASLVRFTASYRAKDDIRAVSQIVQTAALTTAVVVGLALVAFYMPMQEVLRWSIDPRFFGAALEILPWALVSFWVNAISGSFQSGLDGCQRVGQRQIILMAGSAVFVTFAVWQIPVSGIRALAEAQLLQSVLVLVASWFTLKRHVAMPLVPTFWNRGRLKEILSYSVNFQIGSIATMLCEPLTKILLTRFGGLAMTGLYEMAYQVIAKARSVIFSATNVLVPAIAEVAERDSGMLRSVYVKTLQGTAVVIFPIYLVLGLLFPLIAKLWIGELPHDFILFGLVLAFAYFLNGLEVPAHVDNLGTGNIRINTIGQVLMAALNLVLGWLGGFVMGGHGVVYGFITALVVASAIVVRDVHARYGISGRDLIPDFMMGHTFAAVGLAIALLAAVGALAQMNLQAPIWVTATVGAFLFVVVYAVVLLSGRSALIRAKKVSHADA